MAANSAAICASFKQELLGGGFHIFGAAASGVTVSTFNIALYVQNAGVGSGMTAYSTTNEVSGTNYTAGGLALTNTNVALSGTTAYWTPGANPTWTNVTLASAFDCALIYNVSHSNRAVMVLTFPAQTVAAGTFSISMPTNGATTALLQLN